MALAEKASNAILEPRRGVNPDARVKDLTEDGSRSQSEKIIDTEEFR